ncbi:MAG: T9SS type A sorting domain-containing protein [Bacteroidetes bacterium]|nr:T9SS type A sorting domain-containing protein [Bacteroidota bacterium]
MKILLIQFCFISCMFLNTNAQITFQKAFGGTAMDEGNSIQQTTDGGYIIAGTTTSYGVGGRDLLVLKTNSMGDTTWSKTYGGITDNESGFCIKQTSDGGYIVSGVASSFADASGDMYIIKIKANGDTTWTRTYGGIGYEWGASILQTTDGGYIFTGQTPAFGAGAFDVYLVKINGFGNIEWTKTYGGVGSEYGTAVQQTSDGGYIIVGSNDNNFGFGGSDFYLVKTDATGNHIWSKTYGNSGFEEGKAVKQTLDGGYIIAGTSEDALGPLGPDMCLIKTNAVGDTLWSKLYGGAMIDECYDVQQTVDGGFIMVGKSFSFSVNGDYDVYVVKVTGQGVVQWSKTYGGSTTNHNEIGYSIQQTTDKGYIISGETMNGFGIGLKNIYVIKTDSLGNSGCNQGNVATITSHYLPQVANTATLVGTGGMMNLTPTAVNAGTTQTNLCLSVPNIIPEIYNDLSIYAYPNPFYKTITISTNDLVHYNSIKIYSVIGQLVQSKIDIPKSANSKAIVLELDELQDGIYYIDLQATTFHKIIKLVKH